MYPCNFSNSKSHSIASNSETSDKGSVDLTHDNRYFKITSKRQTKLFNPKMNKKKVILGQELEEILKNPMKYGRKEKKFK